MEERPTAEVPAVRIRRWRRVQRPTEAARPPGMDPRIAQRRDEVARHRGRRRTRVLLALLVLAGLVVAIWFVLHTPLFSARHVTVVGSTETPAAQVAAAAGLSGHPR